MNTRDYSRSRGSGSGAEGPRDPYAERAYGCKVVRVPGAKDRLASFAGHVRNTALKSPDTDAMRTVSVGSAFVG